MKTTNESQGLGKRVSNMAYWITTGAILMNACSPVAPSIEKKSILSRGEDSPFETSSKPTPPIPQNLTPPTSIQKTEVRFVSEKTYKTIRAAIEQDSVIELRPQLVLDFSKNGSLELDLKGHTPKAVFVVLKVDMDGIRDSGGYSVEQTDKARLEFQPALSVLGHWTLSISNEAPESLKKAILKQVKTLGLVFTESLKGEDLDPEVSNSPSVDTDSQNKK